MQQYRSKVLVVFLVTNPVTSRKYVGRSKAKKATKLLSLVAFYGSGGRDRTYDQLINSQLLYR